MTLSFLLTILMILSYLTCKCVSIKDYILYSKVLKYLHCLLWIHFSVKLMANMRYPPHSDNPVLRNKFPHSWTSMTVIIWPKRELFLNKTSALHSTRVSLSTSYSLEFRHFTTPPHNLILICVYLRVSCSMSSLNLTSSSPEEDNNFLR